MNRPIIRFFTTLNSTLVQLITQHAPTDFEVSVHSAGLSDQEKSRLIQNADFVILFRCILTDELIQSANRLKLVQLVSSGFDSFNVKLCRELGIPVANNGGVNSIDVAEHVLALILTWYRRILEMDCHVRHNNWRMLDSGQVTYTIHGKTVGLVGLGHIGQKTARLLKAFGADILFYDPYPPADHIVAELGVKRYTLEEMLPRCDIVSLHVPLNETTRGMISTPQLELMKSTALLVNTCRGPVIDEIALLAALAEGQIAGAALDVLEQEPPAIDNPLFAMRNVLLTPHIAGTTHDTWTRRGQFIFENIQRVWDGREAMSVVN